jgi:hypothetical protein
MRAIQVVFCLFIVGYAFHFNPVTTFQKQMFPNPIVDLVHVLGHGATDAPNSSLWLMNL